jgi:hypothetical protein
LRGFHDRRQLELKRMEMLFEVQRKEIEKEIKDKQK